MTMKNVAVVERKIELATVGETMAQAVAQLSQCIGRVRAVGER